MISRGFEGNFFPFLLHPAEGLSQANFLVSRKPALLHMQVSDFSMYASTAP